VISKNIYMDTDLKWGLSKEEALKRLSEYGWNLLPEKPPRNPIVNFFLQFLNPLVYLLFIAAALMFFFGSPTDPLVILVVVILNALMGAIQEGRAERSLISLRKLSALEARVVRDGRQMRIESKYLVPGDVLYLGAGDMVPADCRIVESASLEVIESALTGESIAISKIEGTDEKQSTLYMGTHLSKGRCLAIVTATGEKTEFGQIAKLSEEKAPPKTPIEKRIASFGKHLSIAAVLVFGGLVGIGFLQKHPISEIFFAAISQLVSLIPEGLPAAITIALAVGVQRMAARGAIIRRLAAVETLGSTTVICTDKTGTLTRGEMVATEIFLPDQPIIHVEGIGYQPKGVFSQQDSQIDPHENNALLILLEACVLCNDAKLEYEGGIWKILGDPTEGALIVLARKADLDDQMILREIPRKEEIPFDPKAKMMATIHEAVTLIKGAAEEVLALCNTLLIHDEEQMITEELKKAILDKMHEFALDGKRILGFARIEGEITTTDFASLKGRCLFLGFICLTDPPREEVYEAVKTCQIAGIRPVMVTGDHLVTAKAIAKQLRILKGKAEAMDGASLDAMSDEELRKRIGKVSVFARLHPGQKMRIVECLQKKGDVVAMTGDGVNDAPALARADVGVAMGITGTDVAKEAAKMVITDDNFATIVKAIEQGRLVYKNIKKVIFYLLATNCGAALTMILGIACGFPLPMAAVQILWINVVTEGTVTINLILDPLEGDEMISSPVKSDESFFTRASLVKLVYTIVTMVCLLLGYFIFLVERGTSLPMVQTQVFTLLAFCAWFKMLSSRSETKSCFSISLLKNPYLLFGLIASILLQGAVIYIRPLNEIFHTVPLLPRQVFLLLALGSVFLWIEEFRKWLARRN
jgi:calcium-translocating P-type ATPase